MGLKLTFTILGLLALALLTAPVRYVVSNLLFGDSNCQSKIRYQGELITKSNVYQYSVIKHIRKRKCKDTISQSEQYYNQAVRAFSKRKVYKAKSLVERSLVLYPDERKLLLIGELNLISANQRFKKLKNKKKFVRDYQYSKLKFILAKNVATATNNLKIKRYSVKRIQCIKQVLKKVKYHVFCGGYRNK